MHQILTNNKQYIYSIRDDKTKDFLIGSSYYFVSLMVWALFGKDDFKGTKNKLAYTEESLLEAYEKIAKVDEQKLLDIYCDTIDKVGENHDLDYKQTKKDNIYDLIDVDIAKQFKENVATLLSTSVADASIVEDESQVYNTEMKVS